MKNKRMILALALFALLTGFTGDRQETPKPKLVILLAIDQFPAWYLEHYAPALEKGFHTLITEGRYYPKGLENHAPTLSGVGHASLSTGVLPIKHGFSANEWWVQYADGTYGWQSIFHDDDHHFVGLPGDEEYSPRNLTAAPMTEWFLADNPETRVLSVGLSEVTLLYAPRSKANAFWFSEKYGVFGTSTFYADQIPSWVDNYNRTFLQDFMRANNTWDLSVPEEFRSLAARDERGYEAGGKSYTFPHNPPDEAVYAPIPDASFPEAAGEGVDGEAAPAMHNWFYNAPFADIALLEFAKAGIEAMGLGDGKTTDVLTIAMNSADNIGHRFGPHSLEMLDYLMRLDAALGEFIAYLDARYGRAGYVLGLSSDHGVAPAPEYTLEKGGEAKRITFDEINAFLDGIEDFIADYDGPGADFPEALAVELEKADFIGDALTRADLEGDGPADKYLQLYRNGHVKGKTTDFPLWGKARQLHPALFGIEVRFKENMIFEAATAVHGSPYDYDRQVPIILFGGSIKAAVDPASPNTIDIAPTLATLAGIEVPENVDGNTLEIQK